MTQLELIKKEERTDTNKLFTIFLYKEGGWWRAYEWSSYLCANIKLHNKLKPIHRKLKGSDNGIIFVGLQSISFSKYFGDLLIHHITDNIIEIDVSNYFNNTLIALANHQDILDNWKDTIPIKNQNKKDNSNIIENKTNTEHNINDLLKMIINYQLESKSLIESVQFISELKNIAFNLI